MDNQLHYSRTVRLFVLLLSGMLLAGLPDAFGQAYLNENFNNLPAGPGFSTGWTRVNNGSEESGWVVQEPFTYNGTVLNMLGSKYALANGDAGGSGSVANTTITSPAFNTASANLLFLELDQFFRPYLNTDTAVIEVFDGTVWVKVQAASAVAIGTAAAPVRTRINITQYKNANMRVRFRLSGIWPWYWLIDNISVFQPIPNDVGVTAINSPFGDCGLSASTQVKVLVKNFGSATQTSIPLSYRVGNGTIVNQTFTANLAPDASQEFSFTTTQDLSAPGDYFISAWSGLSGDNITSNDSTKNVKATKASNSFGVVGFTGYNGENISTLFPGWKEGTGASTPTGTTSAWRAPATAQSSYFGTATAALNLYTTSRNEWILTPTVTPGANSGLVYSVAVTNWLNPEPDQMGSDDKVDVLVSTNCGQSWTVLRTYDRNSNLIAKLQKQTIPLATYAGQEIRLAFRGTDGPVDDPEDYDFHLDSIRVVNLPPVDMEAATITSPASGCGVTNPQVTLGITNQGTQPITNPPVCLTINAGTPICQNFQGTLAPGQSAQFTFSNIAQLAQPGDYILQAYTNATGDGDASNNTTPNFSFQNLPSISTYPYTENFETSNGGWIPGGTNFSWALGTPAKTRIQGAGQGNRSYVTGGLGTGTYFSNEKSFVLSPCLNFSSIQNPVFEMKAWWSSEFSEDGAILQSSIDGGATWVTVGAFGDITNWYNDNTIEGLVGIVQGTNPTSRVGWSGGLNDAFGSGGWVTVRNLLNNLGGQPDVRLRIAFGAGTNVAGDGFAFDAIRIYEKLDNDVAFQRLENPQISGCGLSDTTRFRLSVQNVGKNAITSLQFGYRITGRPVVQSQPIAVNIPANGTFTYVFPNVEAMGQIGTYKVQAWARLIGDNFTGNDSTRIYDIAKRGAFDDTVRFTGFVQTGTNLPILYPGWSVSSGNPLPNTTTSLWRACQPNQEAFYGRTVARINMAQANRREWMMAPAYRIQNNAFLNFDVAAVDAFATINDPTGGFNGTDDRLRIMVSQDCGNSWQEIFAVKSGDGVNNVFKNFKVDLAPYAGKEIRIAFWATTFPVSNTNDYDLLLDKIYIETLTPNDVGVVSINSPTVSCGLSNNVSVSVSVRNFSSSPVSNIPVSYRVGLNQPVNALLAGPIPPLTTVAYTFTQTADLSVSQPYTIEAFTSLANDSVITNDRASILLAPLTAPLAPQSLAGYNGSNLSQIWNGWTEARGAQAVPGPSAWTSGNVGGSNSLKIKLSNQSKIDWVVSPGVRINNGNFLRFKAGQFSVNGTNSALFGSDDSVSVLISTNCGQNWRRIFGFKKNAPQGLTNSMQEYSISLAAYANQEVRFGIRARDGNRIEDTSDVYINDIEISSTLTQDGGPVQLLFNPVIAANTFLKDSTYQVIVRITNFGTQPISNVPVTISFPSGQVLTVTVPGPLAPGQSTNANLGNFVPTALGSNLLALVYTSLSGDQALPNDTLNFTYTVTQPVAQTRDAGPLEVRFTPVPGPAGLVVNTPYQVFVKVSNFGSQNLTGIPVAARFPGVPELASNVNIALPSTQFAEVNLGTYTPAATGSGLRAKIFTSLTGDQVVSNDTLTYTFNVVVSTADKIAGTEWTVYPNPTRDEVRIDGLEEGSPARYSLVNVLGKRVWEENVVRAASSSEKLTWSGLAPGMYHLEIVQNQTKRRIQLVIR